MVDDGTASESWLVCVTSKQSEMLKEAAFTLSVASAALISFQAKVQAKAKWTHLRGMQTSMEILSWKFRTRVDCFEVPLESDTGTGKAKVEEVLSEKLKDWREALATGADMQATSLMKKYSASIFVHGQKRDREAKGFSNRRDQEDDFYSPVLPEKYVKLRLKSLLKFYKQRLPSYSSWNTALTVFLIVCSATSAVLARHGQNALMTVVVALASSITSWREFSDMHVKMIRYSHSIRQLEDCLTWWRSLDPVAKADPHVVKQLVQDVERVHALESAGWVAVSMDKKTSGGGGASRGAGGANGNDGAPDGNESGNRKDGRSWDIRARARVVPSV